MNVFIGGHTDDIFNFEQLLTIMKEGKISDKKRLSPKEEAIMDCFWQHGPMFVRELVERWPDPKPHFNTVSTFVRGLEAKGWLGHEQVGNSYRYFPLVDASDYRDRSLRGLIDRFFGKSYIGFVSSLVQEEKISTEELKELIEKIESKKNNGED